MRMLTASLPPCLFVPHTVAAWRSPQHGQAVVAGEALATIGVCTLAALLQGVSVQCNARQLPSTRSVCCVAYLHIFLSIFGDFGEKWMHLGGSMVQPAAWAGSDFGCCIHRLGIVYRLLTRLHCLVPGMRCRVPWISDL
jgi:hypothetical protein